MNRRTFNKLASLAALSALAENKDIQAAQIEPAQSNPANPSDQLILEDREILMAFDKHTGALTRLERKSTRWSIQRRSELGISFRLLAPLPNRRDNFVLGQKQQVSKIIRTSDQQIHIEWEHLNSEHGGVLPITFMAIVTLKNGTVTFESELVNNSTLMVETIDYPYLGDLNAPARDSSLTSEHMWYGNLVSNQIYPHFGNAKGYWGVDFPTKTIDSKQSLFCLLQSPKEGLYVEMHDPTLRYLLEYTFEQHPGTVDSINNLVTQQDEISGKPVHLEFRTCHFIFAHPHSTFKLAPIVMRSYSGDWHAGVDLYKQWRSTWYKQPHIPSWVLDVHSWQQLQINAPEEDYTIPYRELTKYAAECADNGVSAIQLVGWNRGGQDRGDPSQDTDPGLGTWQELHDAIAQIQATGVKMILFGKLNWADMTTEWYKKELYKYEATDPYGIPYQQGGYSYTTPTQLAGINNRRRAVMDFLSPGYRSIAAHEFQKILNLGAAGWLFDEVCHHGPVEYSFSPDHGYTAPGYIYAGDLPMSQLLRSTADRVSPDFLFSGEGPQDWLMQYYPVSYFRINRDSRPVCRYIDPQAPLMVAVTGFDDREMLNQILLYRYIISYEPYYFKGQLTDFPLTLSYGKKIDALRRRYRHYLWDSEFRDTLGAAVTADGSVRHSVFVAQDGKRAVVIVNQEIKKPIMVRLDLPKAQSLIVVTPEQPDPKPTSGKLQIPARSAVVVME
ncbi:MAG TPA: DUF6259 domain-containing protein [Edaphobacter sp.]|nr:DUF6259 domain-containing protein [Edaphobacter sp.]